MNQNQLFGRSRWRLARMQPIYQSYGQMQRFTTDAAHELRTPLAAIRATVESALMMPTIEENEARDTLQTIGRQNQRLSHLVADLLMLCRMDRLTLTGQTQTKQDPVVLNDLVSDVVEEFAALALASKITLKAQIKLSRTLEVLGDAEQLYRLVSNLVINAIQYTPAGGEVTLVLEQERHEALIRVRDTGIGISADEQIQIFERFYRVSSDRSRQTGGSGLGLAIASLILASDCWVSILTIFVFVSASTLAVASTDLTALVTVSTQPEQTILGTFSCSVIVGKNSKDHIFGSLI